MTDIIRCKDCRYFDTTTRCPKPICKNDKGLSYPDPKDFCSHAEKKLPKLKYCPFCGNDGVFIAPYQNNEYGIVCPGCVVEIGTFETEEEVAETWNRRFY